MATIQKCAEGEASPRAAANQGVHVAIMATLGNRSKNWKVESEMVFPGQDFSLCAKSMKGNKHGVSVSYDKLSNILRPGNIVFLDDGDRTDSQARLV